MCYRRFVVVGDVAGTGGVVLVVVLLSTVVVSPTHHHCYYKLMLNQLLVVRIKLTWFGPVVISSWFNDGGGGKLWGCRCILVTTN